MSYKNSVKLITSNFSLVWKQLTFVLISVLISVLLSLLVATPTINLLKSEGWFEKTRELIEAVYVTPNQINATMKEILVSFFDIISTNFSGYFISYIAFILTSVFVPMFLFGVGEFTVCFLASNQLSSYLTLGFTSSLLSNFKSASVYSLGRGLVTFVAFVLIGAFGALYLKLSHGILLTMVMLFLFVAIIVFILSIKLTFLSNIAPKMIEENKPFRKCFASAFRQKSGRFWRTFSNAVICILTIISVNLFFGLFTVFVGLIISIPASMVFKAVFMMTDYYTRTGKKYYISSNLIVEPITSGGDDKETKNN